MAKECPDRINVLCEIAEESVREGVVFDGNKIVEILLWNEDDKELSEQDKKEIAEARAEIKAGKFHTFEEVKRELGLL